MDRSQGVKHLIRWVILLRDKPFVVSDLFQLLRQEYGIEDRMLVLDILNDLIDSGLVECSDVIGNFVKYQSLTAKH